MNKTPNSLNLLLLSGLLFLGVFFFAPKTFATSAFDQTDFSQKSLDIYAGGSTNLGNGHNKAYELDFFLPSTLSGTATVTDISLFLDTTLTNTGCSYEFEVTRSGHTTDAQQLIIHHAGWNKFLMPVPDTLTSYAGAQITLQIGNTFNNTTAGCPNQFWNFYGAGSAPAGASMPNIGFDVAPTPVTPSSVYPAFALNGVLPYDISFHDGFSDYMTTPDFSVWQIDLTFPDGLFNPGWQVEYKSASSTDYTYFDREDFNAFGNGAFIDVSHSLRKKTPLSPGNYEAQAVLFSNGNPLALSSVLHFTVTGAASIITPGTDTVPTSTTYSLGAGAASSNGLFNDSMCTETAFSVLGADFGKGVCQIGAFLFVPSSGAVQGFIGINDKIATKVPFSYFYQMRDALANINTTATSSLATFAINTGTTSPIQINATMFSGSTLKYYTTSTTRGVLRTLMQVALYLAYGTMVFLAGRRLFSKPHQG